LVFDSSSFDSAAGPTLVGDLPIVFDFGPGFFPGGEAIVVTEPLVERGASAGPGLDAAGASREGDGADAGRLFAGDGEANSSRTPDTEAYELLD